MFHYMGKYLILNAAIHMLLAKGDIEWCGIPRPLCLCDMDNGIILCTNPDIVVIPEFPKYIKQTVWKLIIMNTGIHKLFSIRKGEWPALYQITLQNNKYLHCGAVYKELQENVKIKGDGHRIVQTTPTVFGSSKLVPTSNTDAAISPPMPDPHPATQSTKASGMSDTTFSTSVTYTESENTISHHSLSHSAREDFHLTDSHMSLFRSSSGPPTTLHQNRNSDEPTTQSANITSVNPSSTDKLQSNSRKIPDSKKPSVILYATTGTLACLFLITGSVAMAIWLHRKRQQQFKYNVEYHQNVEMIDIFTNPNYTNSVISDHDSYMSESTFDSVSIHTSGNDDGNVF